MYLIKSKFPTSGNPENSEYWDIEVVLNEGDKPIKMKVHYSELELHELMEKLKSSFRIIDPTMKMIWEKIEAYAVHKNK